jgi:hypothetical protein
VICRAARGSIQAFIDGEVDTNIEISVRNYIDNCLRAPSCTAISFSSGWGYVRKRQRTILIPSSPSESTPRCERQMETEPGVLRFPGSG